jgi:hypothetical protein
MLKKIKRLQPVALIVPLSVGQQLVERLVPQKQKKIFFSFFSSLRAPSEKCHAKTMMSRKLTQ